MNNLLFVSVFICFSLGETCSHVGALLFKLEAAVRLGITAAACTGLPCQWNQSFKKKKKSETCKNCGNKFYKRSSKEQCLQSRKAAKRSPPPASEADQQQFLASLESVDCKIVGLSAWSGYCQEFVKLGPAPQTSQLPKVKTLK